MPAVAPALDPRIASSNEIESTSVSFFGRSLAEYAQFFSLDVAALRGRDVLDVAAGPSSFTAEACARKINAVAVDPYYGQTPGTLERQILADYAQMLGQIQGKPHLFNMGGRGHFASIDAAELEWHGAAQRFLSDYATHFIHNRYVSAALPRLPFFDGTFDLVLCAHLLFTYAKRFDFDWHIAACRELVRVTAGEVRLHPLCDNDGRPYRALTRLRRELKENSGITSEVRAVDYKVYAGASSMLVLKKSA